MAGLSYEEARDYILGKFKSQWDAGTPAVNGGTVPSVEYPNVAPASSALAAGNKPWCRISVRHYAGEQRSMGAVGQRMFTRRGMVTVQIFVPAGKQGLVLADRLGKVAVDAFEGEETSAGSVWFHNVAYKEVGIDGNWYQVNAAAEFEYDAVK